MLPYIIIAEHRLSTYWLMYALGVIVMALLLLRSRTRFGFQSKGSAVAFALILAAQGLLGAKLLYILENWESSLQNGIGLGGVSFFGAVWLIGSTMPFIGKCFHLEKGQAMDACGPCVAAMICCLRIGCFFNGCCGAVAVTIGNITFVPPVQLLEALWDAVLLWALLKGEKFRAENGMGYPYFMIGYSGFRFLQEFLRDTPKLEGFLAQGQWYAMLTFILGFAICSTQQAIQAKRKH